MTVPYWKGAPVTKARAQVSRRTDWPTRCAVCGRDLWQGDPWVIGHIQPRHSHPHLTWDESNWRIECTPCSDKSGALITNANKARNNALGMTSTHSFRDNTGNSAAEEFSPKSLSVLSKKIIAPIYRANDPSYIQPRFETPMSRFCTGTYGPQFIAWCQASGLGTPLPWQEHVAMRVLEHDADGVLLWRRVGISVPRQSGKSVLLRFLAAWRLFQELLFGEPQTILHVAHSLNTTEEVFYPAIIWAKTQGLHVREANGQMKIQAGESRWLPRSTQTGYGFALSLVLADEAHAIAERRVSSGYAPTLSERKSGQIVMFSSANEDATPLFPRFREAEREGWLHLEWSVPPDADPADPMVWQQATPVVISKHRAALMADELAADQITFRYERLNQWPEGVGLTWGAKIATFLPMQVDLPMATPPVFAIECDPDGSGWAAASSDGHHVECVRVSRLGDALSWVEARGGREVRCHESVGRMLPTDRVGYTKVTLSEHRAATAVFRDTVRAGNLTWYGSGLTQSMLHAKVSGVAGMEAIDGRASQGTVCVVKAVAWALWAARMSPGAPAVIY